MSTSRTVTIGGIDYPYVKIGDQYWLAKNLQLDITSSTYHYSPYGAYYDVTEINSGIASKLASLGITGWHVPTIEEFNTMVDFVVSDTGSSQRRDAGRYLLADMDNTYGLSLVRCGSYDGRSGYQHVTDDGSTAIYGERSDDDTYTNRVSIGSSLYINGNEGTYRKYCIRLVTNQDPDPGPGPGPGPDNDSNSRICFATSFVIYGGCMLVYNGLRYHQT